MFPISKISGRTTVDEIDVRPVGFFSSTKSLCKIEIEDDEVARHFTAAVSSPFLVQREKTAWSLWRCMTPGPRWCAC